MLFRSVSQSRYLCVPTRNAGNGVSLTATVAQCASNSMRVYSPSVSLQEAVSSILSGSEPSSNCSLSFGNSDGRLQVASFGVNISGYNDAMRSYRLTIGVKKANGKSLPSYSGAVLFATSGSTYIRSEDVTFVWNESSSLYEAVVSFNDIQYSSVKVLLQTAPDIASTSLWQFGVNTASAVAFVEESETTYQTTPFATKNKPANLRLLAYRFRAYESVYNALS